MFSKLSLPGSAIGACLLLAHADPIQSQVEAQTSGTLVVGSIDQMEVDDPADPWSSGMMVVAGQVVIVPRNTIIDLPANRLTLQQMFDQAPPDAKAIGKSGLATLDGLGSTAIATVHGNRTQFGNLIAGYVFIDKGQETASGVVTYIDHTEGYLRVDGINGDSLTGLMVRVNDPIGRFTIQQGLGCDGGPNCSADVRFGVDSDNYTITYATGYPAGIPSTVPLGQRANVPAGMDPSEASDATGVGDPLCPSTNRGVNPVPDSTKFAPILVGDHITAEGNLESIGGAYFLSAHTLTVSVGLTTADDPTQPDYMIFDEAEWDVPGFANERVRSLFIGFTTLPDSQVDLFALHIDPQTNTENEFIMGSTIGNPDTINQGVGATAGGIFKIFYDVDFQDPTPDPRRTPCRNLINRNIAGACPLGGTLIENIAILSPITRDIIGRSSHKAELAAGVVTRDVNGRASQNGEYLNPVGLGFPEFGEIDLDGLATPFVFTGLPWNLDRRLAPGGCDGPCEGSPQPISPFPLSGLNPVANLPLPVADEPFSFFPFGPADVMDPGALAPAPGALPIDPTPVPGPAVGPPPPLPPVAGFSQSATAGVIPLGVSFTDASTGSVGGRLWSFGDGTFSVDTNPVHTYTSAGTFSVSLTAIGAGGNDTITKANVVLAEEPGPASGGLRVNFVAQPRRGPAPLTTTFRTRAEEGTPTSATFDFGDGTTIAVTIGVDVQHIYTTPGFYSVTLTATDGTTTEIVTRNNFILVQ